MASTGHQYATLPREEGRWPLGSSALTPSPQLPELPHTPLSAAFEDLAGTLFVDEPPEQKQKSVSDVLRSFTNSQRSSSYELVEEDDYEHDQVTPRMPKKMADIMAAGRPATPKDDTPVRTASISRHLPLHNPTPDLQSLQGAYLKNVQALEDSAERISLAGSMEEELQKIKYDMRRSESIRRDGNNGRKFSATSNKSNSIIGVNAAARSGVYSPGGFITSPVGSVRSSRQTSQRQSRMSKASNPLPEPELEGRPLESAMVHDPPAHAMQPRPSAESERSISHRSLYRTGTSASNDTYRQAQNLFTDFDGIHFSPAGEDDSHHQRKISLNYPPLARDSRVFREAQPDQNMVYYPAPVPVMLNLPKRLSKGNWAQQEKRRTVALQSIPQENRKSAVWLANAEMDAEYEEEPRSKRMSRLPPQLRASAFFDAPGQKTDIQLKHGSAVITLDSILDAAAHAPVSAFTDHPIAGHLGNEVYGQEPKHKKKNSSEVKAKRRSSLSNMLSRRKSSGTLQGSRRMSQALDNEIEMAEDDPERAAERSLAPDDDELVDGEKPELADEAEGEHESGEEQESEYQPGFQSAPTTLLAELQLRKAHQKLRNRTAANAFPNGMHSTLLEMDAVTQLQQRSRKQKHVALAWEDADAVDKANNDDEDVPLGVLFPEKAGQTLVNFHKPLGLMEKRELEENELLGARRARLRGEQYRPAFSASQYQASLAPRKQAPTIHLDGVDEDSAGEHEGETLAQRRKRMQEKQKGERRNSLADEIASQLGLDPSELGGTKTPEPDLDGQEETLGQRRKRLQAEKEAQEAAARPQLKPKTSMSDLLRANPVGDRNDARQASAEAKINLLTNKRDFSGPLVGHIQAQQPNAKPLPSPQIEQYRSPPPYFPSQPLLGGGLQAGGYMPGMVGGMQIPQMQAMQSMPTVPTMNSFPMQQQQMPYGNMMMNGSNMSLGMNGMNGMNMMYNNNPMMMNMAPMGMNGVQMPMGVAAPAYGDIGMGPPLTPQQRTRIEGWRQGIA